MTDSFFIALFLVVGIALLTIKPLELKSLEPSEE